MTLTTKCNTYQRPLLKHAVNIEMNFCWLILQFLLSLRNVFDVCTIYVKTYYLGAYGLKCKLGKFRVPECDSCQTDYSISASKKKYCYAE